MTSNDVAYDRFVKPRLEYPLSDKILLASGYIFLVLCMAAAIFKFRNDYNFLFVLGILWLALTLMHHHFLSTRVEFGPVVETYVKIHRHLPPRKMTQNELVRQVLYNLYPQGTERDLLARCLKKIERDPTVSNALKDVAREKIDWIVRVR